MGILGVLKINFQTCVRVVIFNIYTLYLVKVPHISHMNNTWGLETFDFNITHLKIHP